MEYGKQFKGSHGVAPSYGDLESTRSLSIHSPLSESLQEMLKTNFTGDFPHNVVYLSQLRRWAYLLTDYQTYLEKSSLPRRQRHEYL